MSYSTTVVEEWRPVVGYDGLFEVSSLGRVRGVDRKVWNKGRRAGHYMHVLGKVKAPWLGGRYPLVRLSRDGVKFTVPVHRLVAEAFLGLAPTAKHEVCHKEGHWNGDAVSNLYWGTRQQNVDDMRRHGTKSRGDRHPNAKLSSAAVAEIRKLRSTKVKLRVIAAQFGVSEATVSMAARGVTWV